MKLSLILLVVAILVFVNASNHHHRSPRKGIHGKTIHNTNRRHHRIASRHPEESEEEKISKARKLVNTTKYVAATTHSSIDAIKRYAFADVQISADGGTGEPYFYMAKTDPNFKDLQKNGKFSVLYSEAPTGNCDNYPLKAKDPQCGILDLTGDVEMIDENSQDYEFAWNTMVEAFPAIDDFDRNDYALLKMDVQAVFTVKPDDSADQIPLEEYLNAQT